MFSVTFMSLLLNTKITGSTNVLVVLFGWLSKKPRTYLFSISTVISQNSQLSLIQKLVRACNPDVAFILAKGGEVTR